MDSEYRNTALAITIAIIVVLIILNALQFFVVSPYLFTTNRAVSIFDFFEHIGNNNIYFLGSSQIEAGIDTRIMGKYVYNLGLSGSTPLLRLIMLNRLIEIKPSVVIIGLSYFDLNDGNSGVDPSKADLISPNADKIKLDFKSRDLFTEEQSKMIDANTIFYNRKFIYNALFAFNHRDRNPSIWNTTNFTIPLNWLDDNWTYQRRIDNIKNWNGTVVDEKDYLQKEALNHTIRELRKSGTKVIILNMPLNPLLSANSSDETRKNSLNYLNSLNSTGVKFYDFETYYSGEYFHDLVHLNDAGRKQFTRLLCPIVQFQ